MRVVNRWKKLALGSLVVLYGLSVVSNAGLLDPLPRLALLLPPVQLFTTLAWQPSPSADVTGYALYHSHQVLGMTITNRVEVGNALTVTLPLLIGIAHSIHVVAYNADGIESEPSNVVVYTPPPVSSLKITKLADGTTQIRFRTSPLSACRVEWTPTLDPPEWRALETLPRVADAIGNVTVDDPDAERNSTRFYRAVKL